ncbi:hypothetical protein PTUN_a2600 [Pseudoalteromonas tunicata]|uniref:Uncharacterized protein n=1 Tax=Pseudoalteromonas tunicata D2 TaxID=87626 RepID=A4CAV7_9GAMM|nr:hypothetical protein PTUN_a2600 [Pseudoalteromonas tunicata]EAR28515.1 hypothetical protein PTD2_21907 [Pseudoalteromonas tunicata D2]
MAAVLRPFCKNEDSLNTVRVLAFVSWRTQDGWLNHFASASEATA